MTALVRRRRDVIVSVATIRPRGARTARAVRAPDAHTPTRSRIYSIDSLTLQFLIKSMTSVFRARLCNILKFLIVRGGTRRPVFINESTRSVQMLSYRRVCLNYFHTSPDLPSVVACVDRCYTRSVRCGLVVSCLCVGTSGSRLFVL